MDWRHKRTTAVDVITWGGPVTSSVWLFFLVQPVQSLLQSHSPLVLTVVFLAQVAVVVILYLSLALRDTYSGAETNPPHLRRYIITLVIMAVFSVLGPLIGGIQWMPSMIYTSAAAGAKLPTKMALTAIGVLVGLTILLGVVIKASWVDLGQGVILVGAIGLITAGITRLIITIRALEQAREEVARLAVYEERLRMARDLHDLLGHSLSLIAVKSELAKHLVKTDPDQAVDEIGDIERVSRDALADVRTAVGGYRRPSIDRELASSKEMLLAANIDMDVRNRVGDISPDAESVLAWTIREGVTNVIRHSQARRCSISIDRVPAGVCCEVRNDSRVSGVGRDRDADRSSGHGLTGLAERVRASGGQMEASRLPDGGFLLTVTLPLAQCETSQRSESTR